MKNPLVSVIIPVYNTEKYIEECIESILHQSYEQLEILLVDDGSTDNSAGHCFKYAEKDKRIHVLQKENGGLISAWVHGVKNSDGEYLYFIDSDDWVDQDAVLRMIQETSGNSHEIICGNYVIEKVNKKQSIPVKQSLAPGVYEGKNLKEKVLPELLGKEIRRIHASRCMKLISRELIEDNLRFINEDITMGEDLSIMLPAFLDAERIVILEEA